MWLSYAMHTETVKYIYLEDFLVTYMYMYSCLLILSSKSDLVSAEHVTEYNRLTLWLNTDLQRTSCGVLPKLPSFFIVWIVLYHCQLPKSIIQGFAQLFNRNDFIHLELSWIQWFSSVWPKRYWFDRHSGFDKKISRDWAVTLHMVKTHGKFYTVYMKSREFP